MYRLDGFMRVLWGCDCSTELFLCYLQIFATKLHLSASNKQKEEIMNMKMNFSMDEIRLKVEEYIKKGSRAAGRPVLTAYYVLTADSTPESERTNIMIALVAIVFPAGIEDLLGQVFMVGKGFAAIYAYKKMKKYITPQIKDKVEAKLDEWFHENVMEVVEPLYLE